LIIFHFSFAIEEKNIISFSRLASEGEKARRREGERRELTPYLPKQWKILPKQWKMRNEK